MPYKFRRVCLLCYRHYLLYSADHLRQMHKLSCEERQPLLKAVIFSHQVTPSVLPGVQPRGLYSPHIFQHGIPQYTMNATFPLSSIEKSTTLPSPNLSQSIKPKQSKTVKVQTSQCLETQPYPEFKFHHTFSMLVVGPTQCGKTYFVQQVLTKNCIKYPSEKSTQIYWFYPYETRSAVAALQNGFKKRCRIAAKRLAAAVANFGCSGQRYEAV